MEGHECLSLSTITDVSVATIQGQLPAPVIFGDWVMKSANSPPCACARQSGHEGWAFTLTRDGAVAEQIRKAIAPVYVGTDIADREKTYKTAKGRTYGSHSAGIGLRALSHGRPRRLGPRRQDRRQVDRRIPRRQGEADAGDRASSAIRRRSCRRRRSASRCASLYADGWRRFKAPMGATLEESEARLRAAREAAPDAWLGTDLVWMFTTVDEAAAYANSIADLNMGCIEDIFPPGNAGKLAELRKRVPMPIWQGDEQGGSYYPEALIMAKSVDRVRVDLTCMGGITGGRAIIDECLAAGVDFGPHMFAHVHSQVFSAWGFDDKPVEWGVPWTRRRPLRRQP